jgi:hypothetical protein
MNAALAELDVAHARLGEQHRSAPRLENAASRADAQFNTLFTERRWEDIGHLLTAHVRAEDRRRGLRREGNDRATLVAEAQAAAAIGVTSMASEVIAIRAQRLALVRTRFETAGPDPFIAELFRIVEVDDDGLMVAAIMFDPDDIDAAIAELDARYLAGEAARYADTWSVITDGHAAVNRRELPPIAPDLVSIDHRRAAAFAPGEGIAYIRAGWDLDQSTTTYIEQVHRLNDFGAVYTHAGHGVSNQGFDAEWRGVDLLTVEDDMVNRCEVFDEADLDAALAKFEQLTRPAPLLENAASRVVERFLAYFAARDWGTMAEILTDDYSSDDRRRVVSAGVRHGRDAEIVNMRAIENLWITDVTATVIATRGEHLTLMRACYSGRDQGPEVYLTEILGVIEIDTDDRISSLVVFDPDDLDTAFEELDARYLAGEAAPYARVWQSALDTLGEANRHEPGPIIRGLTYFDHRRVSFGSGNFGRAVEELWALVPDARYRATAVHALDAHGTVAGLIIEGTDSHGNEMEWSRVVSLVPDESRMHVYEEDDVDTALARFEELRSRARKLENTASQVAERFLERFAAGDWDAIAEILADDFFSEDRRPVVGAGIRHGRDVEIASIRAGADLGGTNMTSPVIATRGARLILTRTQHSGRDQAPEAFRIDVLAIVEIDADNRIAARIVFDPDDLDTALAELDARYLAGDAAAHAHTWSVIANGYGAFNRRELLATTPDGENVDHRRGAAFAPGDMIAYIHAAWDDSPDTKIYIAAVHRLSNLGAVVTHVAHGISQEGFDAEWRDIHILTVEGQAFSRCELFDETDLDAALARFDELTVSAPQLENAATRTWRQIVDAINRRDADGFHALSSADGELEDRRKGLRASHEGSERWRAAEAMCRTPESWHLEVEPIAIRGYRLGLTRERWRDTDEADRPITVESLTLTEVTRDELAHHTLVFDPDDIDAAFEELDARYLVGEAAPHAHTWSVIAKGYGAFNRRELLATTPEWENVDHRRGAAFAPGDMIAYIHAAWDDSPDTKIYIAAVHRLSNLGGVVTHVAHGISQEGFDAEWRDIHILTVERQAFSRCELFDETDLDAALVRFDELSRPAPQLENAASQVCELFKTHFAARDWVSMAEILAEDVCHDDRRRMVGAGVRHGREAHISNLQAIADVQIAKVTLPVAATRGARLVLSRSSYLGPDSGPQTFVAEALEIIEIDADKRVVRVVSFDIDEIDAAFEELDARYVVGEAAAYAHTWSVIARGFAAFNRRELPGFTPDSVNIDHRRARGFPPGDLTAYIGATWDLAPDISANAEAVHRLSNLGAVFAHAVRGTSQDGFYAEWREICLATVEGDLISHIEMFDEADIDAALARFDELNRPAHRLENAASRVAERLAAYFADHDWHAMADTLSDDISTDDRRRVVGAGIRHGRDAEIASMRATAEVGTKNIAVTVMASRGDRLVLTRVCFSGRDQRAEAFLAEVLGVIETNADDRIGAVVVFDLDDIDAALEELDARYLAGEAAPHSHTWSLIARTSAAFNRHVMPPTTPGWVNVDHRRVTAFAPGDMTAYMRATFGVAPDIRFYIEAVHRLTDLGAVFTQAGRGISHEGFEAEWRDVVLMSIDGDQFNRCEVFDETDLDAALARFDELNRPAP